MNSDSQDFHAGAAVANLPAPFQSIDDGGNRFRAAPNQVQHRTGWTEHIERLYQNVRTSRRSLALNSAYGTPAPQYPADWSDKLKARAVVMEAGGQSAGIVGVDMVGVLNGSREHDPRRYINAIRDRASRELGIKCVHLVATHNHSAPVDDVTYAAELVDQVMKALAMAQRNLVPAELGIGWGLSREAFNRVRRPTLFGQNPVYYVTKLSLAFGNIESYDDISGDGSNRQPDPWGPPPRQRVPNTIQELPANNGEVLDKDYYRGQYPDDIVDDEVAVVRIRSRSNPRETIATLVNYAAHAAMLGSGRIVSTEWPGRMMRNVDSRLGGTTVFLQGAAGDSDTWFTNGALDPSGTGDTVAIAEMNGTGARIADEVIRVARSIQSYSTPKSLKTYSHVFDLPDPRYTTYGGLGGRPRVADLGVMRLDNVLAIGFFPGEYFAHYGLRFKRESEVENSFFVGYANDHIGYVPTDDAFDNGEEAYGTTPRGNMGVVRGTGEDHVSKVLGMVKRCAP